MAQLEQAHAQHEQESAAAQASEGQLERYKEKVEVDSLVLVAHSRVTDYTDAKTQFKLPGANTSLYMCIIDIVSNHCCAGAAARIGKKQI